METEQPITWDERLSAIRKKVLIALRRFDRMSDAEDFIQYALVKMLKKFPQSDLQSWHDLALFKYLYASSVNRAKDVAKYRRVRSENPPKAHSVPEAATPLALIREQLLQGLTILGDRERAVIEGELLGLSASEIAKSLGTSVDNVYTLRLRARKTLRDFISDDRR